MTESDVGTAREPRVSFQGSPGAFSELAIRQQWPGGAIAIPQHTFGEAIASVLSGASDYAVIPVENAIAGRVTAALAALDEHQAHIMQRSELRVDVRLCLIAPSGATLAGIRAVHSHPMALAQCRIFFARHEWLVPTPHEDTAGAAHDVAAWADPSIAAIASDAAAARYNLEIITRDIGDARMNWTRFVVVAAR